MPRNQKETAEFVIASFQSLGIELNPSSRLMKMYAVLTGAISVISPSDPDFEIAREAIRDMPVLEFILEQSHAKSHDNGFVSKLRLVGYDSVLPQMDRQDSLGRNTQFELFVAAICQAAGLGPIIYKEPDICCKLDKTSVGFAIKRVKSANKIEKRISEASKQIRGTVYPGFIVLDTSIALNRMNVRIDRAIPEDEFGRQYGEAMDESISDWTNHFIRLEEQEGVIGCIVHDQQIRLDSDGIWALAGMTKVLGTATDAEEQKLFNSVGERYRSGLPNAQHF